MSDNIRKKLIEALCELPHDIDDDEIVIRYSPRRPGHNALNQLLTALEARFAEPKPSSEPAP